MTEGRLAYEGAGHAWESGPSRLYDRLAATFVKTVGGDLAGATVLDVCAGTGAVCRALRDVGASPFAFDASADMLSRLGGAAVLAITGDMCALPFLDRAFDAALSGFGISHVDRPAAALAEMRRVVRPGGVVGAAVFGAAPASASKELVDEVASHFGYERPAWYAHFKTVCEPLSNTPDLLIALAGSAGLTDIEVHDLTVETGIDTPDAVVEYRTGLAYLAPFVATLSTRQRSAFLEQARLAVAHAGQPVRPRVLMLSSRAPA